MKGCHRIIASLILPLSFCGSAIAQNAEPKPPVLNTDANKFDGQGEKLAADKRVLVEGNEPTKIAKSITAPDGTTVIDASGRTMALSFAAFPSTTATTSGQSTTRKPAASSDKLSLLDLEPALYQGMLRYPKFYGDPNMDRATIDGSLLDRQYLLGSLWGARDKLAKHGLVVDASLTQIGQGVASGSGGGTSYFGSGDLWMALDAGRAGLWSGGLVYAHFEGDWGKTVTGTGAVLPLNGDTIMPAAPAALALSEFYLVQGLPSGFAVAAGKANWSAFADTSFFANNERTQFLYEGLINNAVLGAFVPYTSLGAMLLKQVNPEVGVGMLVTSSNTKATKAGFDDLCGCALTYGFSANWTPKIGGKPGLYDALVGFNTKNVTTFDVDQHYLIGEILGQVPIAKKGDNYALTLGGTQYLHANKDARRSDGQPVGIGPFFRFGVSPKDRNLIDRFYSVGVGSKGGLFRRFGDNWGVGWAGTHFSGDLRRDAAILGHRVDSFEHAAEAYYNVALTPAIATSFHAQYINSANPSRNDGLVLAIRLQLDFLEERDRRKTMCTGITLSARDGATIQARTWELGALGF